MYLDTKWYKIHIFHNEKPLPKYPVKLLIHVKNNLLG